MKNWKKGVAFIASSCGILSFGFLAPQPLMAQTLQGQCRQVNQDTFIYRTRSQADPLSALSENERVTLGEETGKDGWIAVTSPTTGFVQAQQLKLCGLTAATVSPLQPTPISPPPRLPFPPQVTPVLPPPSLPWPPPVSTPLPPPNRISLPQSPAILPRPSLGRTAVLPGSCRQVNYSGSEGMTVRSGPGLNFPRVGGVAYQTRVETDPTAARLDAEGRQWLRLLSPVSGWSSNGFPTLNEGNFASCS